MLGLEVFAVKAVMVAVLIERAVAQAKKLARIDLAKPWPLLAFVAAVLITYQWKLYSVAAVIGHAGREQGLLSGGWVDCIISALFLSGGSAFVIDTFKQASNRRQEMHEVKLGTSRNPQPGPGA
jgi:hypothetical protein